MFGLRFLSETQNLRKKGQPPHHTTGVGRTSSTYLEYFNPPGNPSIGAIAMNSSGALRIALTQSRRTSSRSSESSSTPASIGTSAMPHFGHEPGPICTISGCIGHVYLTPSFAGCACEACECPQQLFFGAGFFFEARYLSGSALKACAQCFEQKKYVVPSCSMRPAAFSGSTVIPQTGSSAMTSRFDWVFNCASPQEWRRSTIQNAVSPMSAG